MEWIIAIIVVIVIAWLAISVARRGGKGSEDPPAAEPHRADPAEPGAPAGPGPGLDEEPRHPRPPGDPDPDEDEDDAPRHERPPGNRFD